jgi:hypothetical protein
MYDTIPPLYVGLNDDNLSNYSSDDDNDESDDVLSDDTSNNFNTDDNMSYYRSLPNDNYLPIPIILLLLMPLLFFGFMPIMC